MSGVIRLLAPKLADAVLLVPQDRAAEGIVRLIAGHLQRHCQEWDGGFSIESGFGLPTDVVFRTPDGKPFAPPQDSECCHVRVGLRQVLYLIVHRGGMAGGPELPWWREAHIRVTHHERLHLLSQPSGHPTGNPSQKHGTGATGSRRHG